MVDQTVKQTVLVNNPQGFHLRPISTFASLVKGSRCKVFVSNGEKRVNGESPLELMLLAATKGTELTVEVSGPDASAILAVLLEVIRSIPDEE